MRKTMEHIVYIKGNDNNKARETGNFYETWKGIDENHIWPQSNLNRDTADVHFD